MLRWAIQGTGFIPHAVAKAIQASNGSQLHWVAGCNPEAVTQFHQQYGISHQSDGWEAVLNDPDLDVVYIGCLITSTTC